MRFISFEILATGVFAFECFLRSFKSAAVHSRRAGLCFFGLVFKGLVFKLDNSVNWEAALLAPAQCPDN